MEFNESLEVDKRFFHLIADRFFNTGDEDYVSSRVLYFNQLYRPFFWACAQALEKHLKCALFVRKRPAYFGHDLTKLLDKLLECNNVDVPPKIPHEFLDPVLGDQFERHTIQQVVHRIHAMGNPDSRYGEFELKWSLRDLLVYDFAIKWLREQSLKESQYGFPFLNRVTFTGTNHFASVSLEKRTEQALQYNNFAYFPELQIQEGPGLALWSLSSPQHRNELENDCGARSRFAEQAEDCFKQLVFKKSK